MWDFLSYVDNAHYKSVKVFAMHLLNSSVTDISITMENNQVSHYTLTAKFCLSHSFLIFTSARVCLAQGHFLTCTLKVETGLSTNTNVACLVQMACGMDGNWMIFWKAGSYCTPAVPKHSPWSNILKSWRKMLYFNSLGERLKYLLAFGRRYYLLSSQLVWTTPGD